MIPFCIFILFCIHLFTHSNIYCMPTVSGIGGIIVNKPDKVLMETTV